MGVLITDSASTQNLYPADSFFGSFASFEPASIYAALGRLLFSQTRLRRRTLAVLPAGQPRLAPDSTSIRPAAQIRRRIVKPVDPAPVSGTIDNLKNRLSNIVTGTLQDLADPTPISEERSRQLAVGLWAAWRDLVGACDQKKTDINFSKEPHNIMVDTEQVPADELERVTRSVIRSLSIQQLVTMRSQLKRFTAPLPWKEGEKYEVVRRFIFSVKGKRRHFLLEKVPALHRNWRSSGPIDTNTYLLLKKIRDENKRPTLEEMLELCVLLNKKIDDLGFDAREIADSENYPRDFADAARIARGAVAEGWSYLNEILASCPPEVKENAELQQKARTFLTKAELLFEPLE
jgi:hypothetical protein